MDKSLPRLSVMGAAFLPAIVCAVLALMTGRLMSSPLEPSLMAFPEGLLSRAGVIAGLLTLFTFPGMAFVAFWPSSRPLSSVDVGSRGVLISLLVHIVHLALFKLASVPVVLLSFLALSGLEVLVIALVFRRRAAPEWVWPDISMAGALVLGALTSSYLVFHHDAYVHRELHDYFYRASWMELEEEPAEGLEVRGVTLERTGPWQVEGGGSPPAHFRARLPLEARITYRALTPEEITLRFLWQGPVGSLLEVDCEDRQASALVESAPVEVADEGPVLRYLERGIVVAELPLMVRSERSCQVSAEGKAGAEGLLMDLTGVPLEVIADPAQMEGLTLSHYYQILNIAENVQWAREMLDVRWLTINQPPVWSGVYATLLVFVGGGLWAVHLFFFALIGVLIVFSAGVVHESTSSPSPYLWIPLALIGVSHARIIVSSGSSNFPDNLYALAVVLALSALVRGGALAFAVAGAASSLLRYAGVGLLGVMAGVAPLVYRSRRSLLLRSGLAWVGILALVGGMGAIIALATGQWSESLKILYFETLPEHFHDNYDMREWLSRPQEFYGQLLAFSGYLPLMFFIARSPLSKLLLITTLAYSSILSVVDHHPTHYYVPLLYLIAIASSEVTASAAGWKRWVLWGLSVLGLLLGLRVPV